MFHYPYPFKIVQYLFIPLLDQPASTTVGFCSEICWPLSPPVVLTHPLLWLTNSTDPCRNEHDLKKNIASEIGSGVDLKNLFEIISGLKIYGFPMVSPLVSPLVSAVSISPHPTGPGPSRSRCSEARRSARQSPRPLGAPTPWSKMSKWVVVICCVTKQKNAESHQLKHCTTKT